VAHVDGFLGRAVATLRARLQENDGLRAGVAPGDRWHRGAGSTAPGTSGEVDAQIFELARSGYRMREVDELLDEVASLLAQLEAENEALRARRAAGG
jgi:DivIVA domain-containing protein